MGKYHLLSVNEDQLKRSQGCDENFLSMIGAAVILACLGQDTSGVTINGAGSSSVGPAITIKHVAEHDCEHMQLWAWSSGEEVAIADLSPEDLDLLVRLAYSLQARSAGNG